MGHWHDNGPPVYYRDFAYTSTRKTILRMANGDNIGDAPAHTFAEYVLPYDDPFIDHTPLPSFAVAEPAPKGKRPPLAHRINSSRLLTQAHAKALRKRLLSGPLVDVIVGPSKRRWSLHRNLLAHHSDHLASELHQPQQQQDAVDGASPKSPKTPKKLHATANSVDEGDSSSNQRLDLPDADPAGFALFVKYLYQGKIDDVSLQPDAAKKYDYAVACHKLYLLCERFDMPVLKNMAIDQYRKGLFTSRLVPDAEEINHIYRQSPSGSPFRRLMTQIAARQIMDPDSEKDAENYRQCFNGNPDFAVDLVNAIKWGVGGGVLFDDPTDGDECEYHDHDNGPNCHVKGKARQASAKTSPSKLAAAPAQPPAQAQAPAPPAPAQAQPPARAPTPTTPSAPSAPPAPPAPSAPSAPSTQSTPPSQLPPKLAKKPALAKANAVPSTKDPPKRDLVTSKPPADVPTPKQVHWEVNGVAASDDGDGRPGSGLGSTGTADGAKKQPPKLRRSRPVRKG